MLAEVTVPASKSLTARRLVLAHLAGSPPAADLRGGDDTRQMVAALTALGRAPASDDPVTVRCGRAGTVARFLLPLAAAGRVPVRFTADPQLQARPLAVLVEALRTLGASIDRDRLPLTLVPGPQSTAVVDLDARSSSQFVSGLLLAAPALPEGLTVRFRGAPSRGHLEMTIHCLARAGVPVHANLWREDGGTSGEVHVAAAPVLPETTPWEGDLPAAAPFLLVPAVLTPDPTPLGPLASPSVPLDTRVTVTNLPHAGVQRRIELEQALTAWGCTLTFAGRGTTCTRTSLLRPGLDLDLRDNVELLPVLAAAAANADAPSRFTGVHHARGHESDRPAVLAANLRAIGIETREHDDELVVIPGPTRPGPWATCGDHRLVMAGALASLIEPGTALDDATVVSKTFPEFLDRWRTMLHGASA